ncbi:MAG TPA: sulfite exporter TauE/SafE family protein [Polyangia bacterium]
MLVAAAALAGGMNALAGGGTLVTFPSLLAFGVTPVAANATSTVALVPGGIGGFWGFRHDVAGDRKELLWMAAPSLVGGALGALLVLWVGNRTFARVVPWLIYGATVLFVAQAPLRRWLDRRIGADGHKRRRALQLLAQFAISIYGGFFGAAMGILMLAMLGLVGHENLARMNGLKNFAGVAINLTAAGIFIAGGQVHWPLALAMMAGSIAGGYAAARGSRRVNPRWVRAFVVVIGVVMGTFTLVKSI